MLNVKFYCNIALQRYICFSICQYYFTNSRIKVAVRVYLFLGMNKMRSTAFGWVGHSSTPEQVAAGAADGGAEPQPLTAACGCQQGTKPQGGGCKGSAPQTGAAPADTCGTEAGTLGRWKRLPIRDAERRRNARLTVWAGGGLGLQGVPDGQPQVEAKRSGTDWLPRACRQLRQLSKLNHGQRARQPRIRCEAPLTLPRLLPPAAAACEAARRAGQPSAQARHLRRVPSEASP